MSEQVKYYEPDGTERLEILAPLDERRPPVAVEGEIGPWPAVALVLGSISIVAMFLLGLVWILLG